MSFGVETGNVFALLDDENEDPQQLAKAVKPAEKKAPVKKEEKPAGRTTCCCCCVQQLH